MGCGTSKNGAQVEGVPGKKATCPPTTVAVPAAKAANIVEESKDIHASPPVIAHVQTAALACEETSPAPDNAPPKKGDAQEGPQQKQHREEAGSSGGDTQPPAAVPVTKPSGTRHDSQEVGPESAPAEDAECAQSRERAAEAASSADRMSPAERPSAPRHGALPPIRTRTSQPNADDVLAAAPADESKLQSRFKALAAEEDDMPASPQAFAVSRSLNRSIGVRRRTSDADGSLAASDTTLAAARRAAEEERELAEPDPLREQFEREKENNPLLRRPTIISARNSEKSMKSLMSLKSMKSLKSLKSMKSNKSKSSKRPSVGFALGEEEEYDVDPDAHLEAERIASITMPDEEPARAVRMAAVGLGVEPPVREESESGSASGEQRGGSGGGAQQESR